VLGVHLYAPYDAAMSAIRAAEPKNATLAIVKKPCASDHAIAIRDGSATEPHACPSIVDVNVAGANAPFLEVQFVEDYPGAPGTMRVFRITEDRPLGGIADARAFVAFANAKYGLPQNVTHRFAALPSADSTYEAFWCSPDIVNCSHVPNGQPSRDSANVQRPKDPAAFDLDPLPTEVQGNEDAAPLLALDVNANDAQLDFFDSDYVEARRKAIQAYYDAQPAKPRT
jgi:hypothetical protein